MTTIADGGAPADVRAGADSVFAYLERTAEPVRAGVRWRTLSYQNTPEYAPGLWDGTAGIALFLADYERLTADGRGAHLARAALAWSTGAAPTEIDSDEGYAASLGWGWSGIGLAWLRLAAVTGRDAPRAAAAVMGERVLAAGPGPRVSLLQGAAGRGAFLVRLWAATGDGRFLAGAVACAEALRTRLLPIACGGAWPPEVASAKGPAAGVPLGYAGGLAGVGHFFARVAAHTGDATWHKAARDIATLLAASAHPERGGINWPPALGAGPTRLPDLGHPRCQWCIGGAGIGLFYAAASELLADAKWREMAVAAGQATYAYGDGRGNPGYCHGLAGNAQLFIELHRLTGEAVWSERAQEFAGRALAYRRSGPEGESWPADEPGLIAPNFSTGAAGVGHCFLRVLDPSAVPVALP